MARIITITSGKGGAGKTSISLNLALALSAKGYKVCVFDADLGLANLNILTGLHPRENLEAVLNGRCTLEEILIRDYQGIDIIPGSTGVEKLVNISSRETEALIGSFLGLDDYDFFIFDTSAGISPQVLSFCMAAGEIILVITPEPTSLTDAYSLIKVLSGNGYNRPVRVLVNQVRKPEAARKAYGQFKDTVTRFLSADLRPLGMVVEDKHVPMAVIAQTPFYLLFPQSRARACIKSITDKLIRDKGEETAMASFWERCISFLGAPGEASPGYLTQTGPSFKNDLHPKNNSLQEKGSPGREKNSPQESSREVSMLTIIQGMEKKIDLLVEEINSLKAMISSMGVQKSPPPNIPEKEKCPDEFVLDFEAWLEERRIT